MKKTLVLSFVFIQLVLVSCSSPELNGHYHLYMNRNSECFQIWNIKENRMKINNVVIDSCFASTISFKRNKITVSPWVDVVYEAEYKMLDNGTLEMYNEYTVKGFDDLPQIVCDTFWLVPHNNCEPVCTYFNSKTKKNTTNFNLINDVYVGNCVFPQKHENELIIGGDPQNPFYIFNDKKVWEDCDEGFNINVADSKNMVWAHIDKDITLKKVFPIVFELYQKGYTIAYSAMTSENNEQVVLSYRNIVNAQKRDNFYFFDYCEFCEKHKSITDKSIINISFQANGEAQINNNPCADFRGYLEKYMGKNRQNRIGTEMHIEYDGNLRFENYFGILSELDFLNHSLANIIRYKDENDIDFLYIVDKQKKDEDLSVEFPLRIREKLTIDND